MLATSPMLLFERRIPTRGETSRRPLRGAACALFTALALIGLTVGAPADASAQTQSWNIVVAPTITIDGRSFPIPGATIRVSVTPPSGTFSVPTTTFGPVSIGTCSISITSTSGSGTFDTALNLTMNTTVSSTPSNEDCPSGPLTVTSLPSGGARLDKPFPSATTTTSPGTLSGSAFGFSGSGNFTASCVSGCVAPSPPSSVVQATSAAKQAASLGTIAMTTTTVQTTNIGLRLNALRGGATGASAISSASAAMSQCGNKPLT